MKNMPKSGYVDGFVLPVPKKNLADYKKMAKLGCKVWMEHGALQYIESIGEDIKKNPWSLSFPELVKPKRGEIIVFAFIVFKNRKHRDAVNKKAMADPRMNPEDIPNMPFDCRRMAYNGFEVLVSS